MGEEACGSLVADRVSVPRTRGSLTKSAGARNSSSGGLLQPATIGIHQSPVTLTPRFPKIAGSLSTLLLIFPLPPPMAAL